MSRVSRWVMLLFALGLALALTACNQSQEDVLSEPPVGGEATPTSMGEIVLEATVTPLPGAGEEGGVASVEATATISGTTGVTSEGGLATSETTTDTTTLASPTAVADIPSTPLATTTTGELGATPLPEATTIAISPEMQTATPAPVDPVTGVASTGDATPGTYKVVAGDTLYSIATKHNTTVEELRTLNNLTSNFIFVGQELRVPGTGGGTPAATPVPGPGGTRTHTVQRGEWLYSIARQYNINPEAIRRANPGVNLDVVYPGQQLVIPQS